MEFYDRSWKKSWNFKCLKACIKLPFALHSPFPLSVLLVCNDRAQIMDEQQGGGRVVM